MDKDCKYCVDAERYMGAPWTRGICLFYMQALKRFDGLDWGHFPQCSEENCPKLHPEYYQNEATLITQE